MAKTKTLTSAFNAGELSPKVYGRVDLEQYYNGCKSLKNSIVYPQGGTSKRYGLEYLVNITKDENYPLLYSETRIESFTFNSLEKYVIIFRGNETILVYEVGVEPPKLVSVLTNTGYADEHLDQISVAQSDDTMIITHFNVPPKRLIRDRRDVDLVFRLEPLALQNIPEYTFFNQGTNVWDEVELTFSNYYNNMPYGFTVDGVQKNFTFKITYSPEYPGGPSLNEDVTGTVNDLNAALAGKYTAQAVYRIKTVDTGRVEPDSYQFFVRIDLTAVTSGADDVIVPTTSNVFATPVGGGGGVGTPEPVWSETRGWPATCVFHGGRLWFGGSASRPQTLWASRSAGYFDFGVTDPDNLLANDALDITLNDTSSNLITALVSQSDLLVFTNGGIFKIFGDTDGIIKPTAVDASKQSDFGSKFIQPVQMDNSTFFLQNSGAQLNSLNYDFTRDSYQTVEQAVLSDHLLTDPIGMSVVNAGEVYNANYMFILNGDGTCALFNRLESQATSTWTPFSTDGRIKSLCGVYDEMYCLVERDKGLGVEVSLERYREGNMYSDCHVNLFNNFARDYVYVVDLPDVFEGKTLKGNLDGYPVDIPWVVVDKQLSGGTAEVIELPFEAHNVHLGLPLEWEITTMPYAPNLQSGNGKFTSKRIFSVSCDMQQSLGFTIKYNNRSYVVPDRVMGFELGVAPVPRDEVVERRLLGYTKDGTITITDNRAVPCNLRSLQMEVKLKG